MGNSSSSSDGGTTSATNNTEQRSSRPSLSSRGLSHRITGGGSNNNVEHHRSTGFSLPNVSLPSPFRTGGSLGLSRAELDARCQPSGLYPTCEWDPKQIRRLISNGHLAARLKGSDSRLTKTDRECPICFMYYTETNISKCCNATLCTECYLQIKSQKDKHTSCPFCNNPKMTIYVQKGMNEIDVTNREEEEQRVIEATIMGRINNLNGEHPGTRSESGGEGQQQSEHSTVSEGGSSFGSSLENYNRNRTFSNSSSSGVSTGSGGECPQTPTRTRIESEESVLQSLAMSPDDRRALENEMRAQLNHETHRRMESEAEEARDRHTQEWYGSAAGMRSRVREARLAELTGLLERMGARSANSNDVDGEGGESSLMARGDGLGGRAGRVGGGGASLSRLLRAMEAASGSGSGGSRNSTLEDLMRLEAAFMVGMDGDARRASRRSLGRSSNRSSNEDTEGSSSNRPARRGLANNRGGVSSTHLDTAELLMRGVSEEEQLAMAIAMSMQDAQEQQAQSTEEEEGGDVEDQQGEASADAVHLLEENSSSSSESSSSDSDSSSSEEGERTEETNTNNVNEGSNIDNDNDAEVDNDAVSLDEDEEEVVFDNTNV